MRDLFSYKTRYKSLSKNSACIGYSKFIRSILVFKGGKILNITYLHEQHWGDELFPNFLNTQLKALKTYFQHTVFHKPKGLKVELFYRPLIDWFLEHHQVNNKIMFITPPLSFIFKYFVTLTLVLKGVTLCLFQKLSLKVKDWILCQVTCKKDI